MSLTSCIKKAGKHLLPEDAAAILKASAEFRAQGMSTAEAAHAAKLQQLEVVRALIAAGETGVLNQSAQPFYSALTRGIESLPTKSADAAGWTAAIKGLVASGKAKQVEVEAVGLPEWLAMQQGKISKDQVLGYLNANGVQVTETVLGYVPPTDEGLAKRKAVFDKYQPEIDAIYKAQDAAIKGPQSQFDTAKFRELGDELERVMRLRDARADVAYRLPVDDAAGANFSTYQLPGGSNYRELLLTLPAKDDLPPGFEAVRVGDGWGIKFPDGATLGGWRTREDAVASQKNQAGAPVYRSGHWDQPNVLAHVRLNDRTDAQGRRVLFVEEIQSDWGQAGSAKKPDGSRVGFDTKENRAARASIEREADALREESNNIQRTPQHLQSMEKSRRVWEINQRLQELAAAAPLRIGIPAAPFVTKTDAWVALALKRVIKMAVDEGYDAVALINGEQSADRYDLSKQVDQIWISRTEKSGTWEVSATKDGKHLFDEQTPDLSRVEALVGKDIAAQVQDLKPGEDKKITGDGLRVGGRGMVAFYDSIVPSVLKDVLRKVGGGAMGTVQFGDTQAAMLKEMGISAAEWAGMSASTRDTVLADSAQKDMQQPGFDITPKMREAAAGGLPLFQNPDEKALAQIAFQPDIRSGESVITLLDGANLSSFVHESSHLFLEIQTDLAVRIQARIDSGETVTDLERGIVDDMGRLLKWFGITGSEAASGGKGRLFIREVRTHLPASVLTTLALAKALKPTGGACTLPRIVALPRATLSGWLVGRRFND
jgi:hypothetical protein